MKIFKSQYFFYILLSALLVVLGISFMLVGETTFSIKNRNFYAAVSLYNESNGPVSSDEVYYGQTIYAIKPWIYCWAGANGNGMEVDISASTVTSLISKSVNADAKGGFYDSKGGYTCKFNDLYYIAEVYMTWYNGSETYNVSNESSEQEFVSYQVKNVKFSAKLTIKSGRNVTCTFYDENGTTQLAQLTGEYADYLTCTTYNEPPAKHFTGWKVGSSGSNCGSSQVRVFGNGSADSLIATYYATYAWNTYTTIFNANGGSGSATHSCTYNSSYTTPSSGFTKTGYKLVSWNTEADGSGTKYELGASYSNLTSVHNGSVTLYAQWEPIKYYVQFNANGGTGTMDKQQLTYGKSETLNTNLFTRAGSGLCFGGWKKTASGVSANYVQGASYTFNLSTTENATVNLYVHWKNETYNLLYYETMEDFNSGETPTQSDIVGFNGEYTFRNITRTGYIFLGWLIGQNSDSTVAPALANRRMFGRNQKIDNLPDFGNNGMSDITINVPVIAMWSPIKYKVEFNANGGRGSMNTFERTFDGSEDSLPENTFTRAGYNFVGWSTNNSLSGITSADSSWPSTIRRNWFRGEQVIYTNGGNKGRYTINPDITSSTYYQGNDIYFVTGSDEDPGIVWITTGNENLGTFCSIINNQNDSITLYAIWEAVDYEIVFDGNGATGGSITNQARIYDVQKALPSNTFERNGYLFLGWHRDKDLADAGQVEYINRQSFTNIEYFDQETKVSRTVVEGDQVTLYAVWKETWAVHNEKPSGSGSTTDPYLIANAQNLAWLSWKYEEGTSFDNGTTTPVCVQTANIDLIEYEWLPIGNLDNSFMGVYDGNGYIITNLQTFRITNVTRTNIGLFGHSTSATIKNTRVYGNIQANDYTGGIVGYAINTNISNCTNNATINVGNAGGGISGYLKSGSITSCYNYGNITVSTSSGFGVAGGITAYAESSSVSNCYSTGTITGYYAGGITGGMTSTGNTMTSCAFEGTATGVYSGGLSGFLNDANVSDCYAKAQVSSTANKGIYADGEGKILNCIIERFKIIEGIETIEYKDYTGTDFSNWIISSDGRPLPSGLSWLAIGGTKVTHISQISANYTKF